MALYKFDYYYYYYYYYYSGTQHVHQRQSSTSITLENKTIKVLMKVNTLDIYVNIQMVIYTQYHGTVPPAKYLPITTVFCWKSTPKQIFDIIVSTAKKRK